MIKQQSLLHLLQLSSPSLPVGSYAYSQGLESVVDMKWVEDEATLTDWLQGTLYGSVCNVDLPILKRLFSAFEKKDTKAIQVWNTKLFAYRETYELRKEEKDKGHAIVKLLNELGIQSSDILDESTTGFITGYACACHAWNIELADAGQAYVWSWLENQLVSAMKIMPIGQFASQKILQKLINEIPSVVEIGFAKTDDMIGTILPAQAIASALHETQYSRLFRS